MIYLLIVLGIVLCVFAVLWGREKKQNRVLTRRYEQLSQEIENFLRKPDKANFSLEENKTDELQNQIARLEEDVLLSRNRLKKEQQRNHHFIADISHQLKTPLAAMRLYAELAPGMYQEKELILIDRMEKLIYQLLRIEKLRAGAYQMKFETTDLRAFVEEIWQEVQALYPRRRLEIYGQVTMRIDPFWMKEALQNILKNACEQGAVRPEILFTMSEIEGMVRLEIEDFGGGVKDLDVRQLFDRFNRSAQIENPKNSGLGLAITKTIVQSHHGSIYAENTENGLRISIFLPVQEGYQSY